MERFYKYRLDHLRVPLTTSNSNADEVKMVNRYDQFGDLPEYKPLSYSTAAKADFWPLDDYQLSSYR